MSEALNYDPEGDWILSELLKLTLADVGIVEVDDARSLYPHRLDHEATE